MGKIILIGIIFEFDPVLAGLFCLETIISINSTHIELELEFMLSFLCKFVYFPIDGVVSASCLCEKGKFLPIIINNWVGSQPTVRQCKAKKVG